MPQVEGKPSADRRSLEEIVDTFVGSRKGITILEAGCGSMSRFNYRKDARMVGIDISKEQLDKNTLLHEKILGDLESYPLPESQYDIIVCWDVLEHLRHPKLALRNFSNAVNRGGVIVLASPNVLTLRGLLTKLTPHIVHILYYRYVVGLSDAGKPGNYPFMSYHRFAMSPPAIRKFARKHGLAVEVSRFNSWDHPEYRFRAFTVVWGIMNKLVNAVTFGMIGTDDDQGFQIILRKK